MKGIIRPLGKMVCGMNPEREFYVYSITNIKILTIMQITFLIGK